jgi:spore germination protein
MAYDQDTDDAKLVNQNKLSGNLYRPVADIEWVKKVVTVALWDIPAKKIVIGVPTYGYKYELIYGTSTVPTYKRIGSMNYSYADQLAQQLHVSPSRNSAGELSYVFATTTGVNGEYLGREKQYLIWYSDAQAIKDKIDLAKLYKLGGISIFKIDGGYDPNIWSILK